MIETRVGHPNPLGGRIMCVCLVGDILFVFILCAIGTFEGARRGVIALRERRRLRAGRCRCGYDLAGLQRDVCPECGSVVRSMGA